MSSLKEKLELISGIRAGNLWGWSKTDHQLYRYFVEKLKGNVNLNIWIYRKRTVSTVNSFKRTNLCKHYRPWFMIYQDLEETEYEYKRAAKKNQRTMKKNMHLYSSLRYAWCYLIDTAISCLNLTFMSSSNRFLWLSGCENSLVNSQAPHAEWPIGPMAAFIETSSGTTTSITSKQCNQQNANNSSDVWKNWWNFRFGLG